MSYVSFAQISAHRAARQTGGLGGIGQDCMETESPPAKEGLYSTRIGRQERTSGSRAL